MPVQVTPFRGSRLTELALNQQNRQDRLAAQSRQFAQNDRRLDLVEGGQRQRQEQFDARQQSFAQQQELAVVGMAQEHLAKSYEAVQGRPPEQAKAEFQRRTVPFFQRLNQIPGLEGTQDAMIDFVSNQVQAESFNPRHRPNFEKFVRGLSPTGEMVTYRQFSDGSVQLSGDFQLPAEPGEDGFTLGPDQVRFDAQGREIARGPAKPKPAAQEKVERERQEAYSALAMTNQQFVDLLSDEDFAGAVGPVQGSGFAQFFGRSFGTETQTLRKRAKRLMSSMVLKASEALKGSPSDNDMQIVKDTKPDLSDDDEVWIDWYQTEFLPIVNKAAADAGQPELPNPFAPRPPENDSSDSQFPGVTRNDAIQEAIRRGLISGS